MTSGQTHQAVNTAAFRPLGREAAKSAIASRLALLGHAPDLLDGPAISALIDHAGGSPQRLRAALASALFLASTEDAPRIGRALVMRALQDEAPPDAARPPTRPAASPRLFYAALGGLVLVALGAVVFWSVTPPAAPPANRFAANIPPVVPAPGVSGPAAPSSGPAPPAQSQPPAATSPPQPSRASPMPPQAVAPSTPAFSNQAPPPQPSRPAAVADLRPPVVVRSLPVPPQSVPLQSAPPHSIPADVQAPPAGAAAQPRAAPAPPPDLPAGPTSKAVLLFPARDPATYKRLESLAQRLREAGIAEVETRPIFVPRARRPVSYFFADDLPLAQKVTDILAAQGWPRLSGNSLAPRLVLAPTGLPSRHPGVIEIQLP